MSSKLDNGTRQKVSVAREVARQPEIILFDEPITNVDAASKFQLKRSLKELTRTLQQTIVYVTHDQTEAMTLADQIALMEEGKIVQCADPRELYNHPADRFAGWFLGNPGMVFFDASGMANGSDQLRSPLFPRPLAIDGSGGSAVASLGIRPEHIQVTVQPGESTRTGRVAAKVGPDRRAVSPGPVDTGPGRTGLQGQSRALRRRTTPRLWPRLCGIATGSCRPV